MSGTKTGVYLCEGCGIGGAVAVDELEALATGDLKVPTVRRHAAFCSEEGAGAIGEDVKSGEVSHAVIAACSPRVMADRFSFAGALTIRANLREQVVWSQPAGEEDTQMLAADAVRMAVASAGRIEAPEPHWDAAGSLTLRVVGGGGRGPTAALAASKAGAEVVLVEKTSQLGGWAAKWSKTIPHRPPYRGLQDNPLAGLIAEAEADPKITIRTETIVARTDGMPGRFTVQLHKGAGAQPGEPAGEPASELASELASKLAWDVFGAIVVATGWRPWDASKLEHLGYGASPDIITDIAFEELAAASGGLARPSDGKAPEIVAFIIPPDSDRMPYSSGVSDRIAIKQALQVADGVPGAMVYVIYEDLRAHGMAEEFYRQAQEAGVVFQKGRVQSVGADLTVTVKDELLGEEIPLAGLDMVVLSTGMAPNSTNVDLEPADAGADQLKDDINPRVPITFAGRLVNGNDTSPQKVAEENGDESLPGGPVLNLQYRQGPHLPVLANGFADSHYICFPYETRRTGIYTCGPVRRPMTISEAREDAAGAVLKAIQAMRASHGAEAVHPRAGDLSYPEFGLDICTKCRRCTVECPFGAIDELENGYPQLNAARCRRCGTCMGACPVRTISFRNYNVQMVADMIRAVEMPDEFAEKPRILVLACENDAYPALDMAGINRHRISPYIRTIPVRCLGSVTMLWISTALESGYDGVLLMGCKSGDDYQCHFVKGSGIAEERMSKAGETLKSLMLEEERVQMAEVSIADSAKAPEILNGFAGRIEAIGLNPFKGF